MRARNVVTAFTFLFAALVYANLPDLDAEAKQSPNAQGATVFVPVNVTDSKNVPVTTLKAEHFQVLEENKEQKITYVSAPGEPMTVGVVLALSSRGPVKAPGQRDRTTVDILAAVERVREANGAGIPAMFDQLPLDSDGLYALVSRSITTLDQQASRRKALVVVGDGLISNGSSVQSMQLPKALIETARRVQFPIYFLFTVTSLPEPPLVEGSTYAAGFSMQEIASASGGQVITGMIENNLGSSASRLRDSLKGQYVLGFTSANTAKDGKWRKLTVKVNPPADFSKVKVTAKSRYFVPKAE